MYARFAPILFLATVVFGARPVDAWDPDPMFTPGCDPVVLSDGTNEWTTGAAVLVLGGSDFVFDRDNKYVYVRFDATTDSSFSGYQDLFLWGGGYATNGHCYGLFAGFRDGELFLGQQCNGDLTLIPTATFAPLTSTRYVFEFYYDKTFGISSVWVDGVRLTSNPNNNWNIAGYTDGDISIGYGGHYSTSEPWGGAIHAAEFYECARMCDASYAIEHGTPGACELESQMMFSVSCKPMCDAGYYLVGDRYCDYGSLTDTAVCVSYAYQPTCGALYNSSTDGARAYALPEREFTATGVYYAHVEVTYYVPSETTTLFIWGGSSGTSSSCGGLRGALSSGGLMFMDAQCNGPIGDQNSKWVETSGYWLTENARYVFEFYYDSQTFLARMWKTCVEFCGVDETLGVTTETTPVGGTVPSSGSGESKLILERGPLSVGYDTHAGAKDFTGTLYSAAFFDCAPPPTCTCCEANRLKYGFSAGRECEVREDSWVV